MFDWEGKEGGSARSWGWGTNVNTTQCIKQK